MKKEMFRVLPIFLLVLGGWGCQRSKETEVPAREPKKKAEEKAGSKVLALKPFIYDSQGERDPFVPQWGAEEGPKLSWLSLEGILWKQENPLAIINDRIVSRGDIIQGAEVIEIKKDGVLLRYGEEKTILRLK